MFRRRRQAEPSVYDALRGHLLALHPAEFGLVPTPELPRVWGLIVDMGYPNATATLVGLADGTTSLYLSTGGGVIGGGEHAHVADAPRAMLAVAERHVDEMPATADLGVPRPGRVVLRAMTYDGQRAVDADEGELVARHHRLGEVYHAAHGVITHLRLLQDSREGRD